MSISPTKPIRSPSYPNMSLRDAIDAIRKIEGRYRSSPIDRSDAAKLIGYKSLSGPAAKTLAALASYGLLERAGKGEARVTAKARAILHSSSDQEKRENLLSAAFEPDLFREIRDRFQGISQPPEEGVITYLNRMGFNPSAVRPAARAFLQTIAYVEEFLEESRDDVSVNENAESYTETNESSQHQNKVHSHNIEEKIGNTFICAKEWFRVRVGTGKQIIILYEGDDEIDSTSIQKLIKLLEAQKEALED